MQRKQNTGETTNAEMTSTNAGERTMTNTVEKAAANLRETAAAPMRAGKPSGFVAYDVSIQLIAALRPIVPAIERGDRDLGDQIRRAASSVALNLAEGWYSQKGNKQKHYAIAHGSANEVRAALECARAWGWIVNAASVEALADRLMRLLWGLTHPRC